MWHILGARDTVLVPAPCHVPSRATPTHAQEGERGIALRHIIRAAFCMVFCPDRPRRSANSRICVAAPSAKALFASIVATIRARAWVQPASNASDRLVAVTEKLSSSTTTACTILQYP